MGDAFAPALVERANWKGAVVSTAWLNCWAMVRAVSRRIDVSSHDPSDTAVILRKSRHTNQTHRVLDLLRYFGSGQRLANVEQQMGVPWRIQQRSQVFSSPLEGPSAAPLFDDLRFFASLASSSSKSLGTNSINARG